MSMTLTGRLTVVYTSDTDYNNFLATIAADTPHLTLVTSDAITRTIIFDVNIAEA